MLWSYINGKFVPKEEAMVHADDLGLLRGYGVFDFFRTYNGKPFLLHEHLDRFESSAQELGLNVPLPRPSLEKIIKELLLKSEMENASFRLILTGGRTEDGMNFNPDTPTFIILVEKPHALAQSCYTDGVKLMTHEFLREIPPAKVLNYITAVKLQPKKKREGALEILYTWQGRVLEATTSNFFLFRGDTLVTPKRDVLIGMTRDFVLGLARKVYKIEERDLYVSELKEADEAFITATNKEIVPVVRINAITVGNGQVGERTKVLLKKFHEHTRSYEKEAFYA
ncbi:MAG TPA: aminotransferase class IV [Patescibacteria group bacterium]|nr:aminotransferase class IV [Patescibacteria group bacterium]